jgi:autonomous glycyl radical cofactor GrcA
MNRECLLVGIRWLRCEISAARRVATQCSSSKDWIVLIDEVGHMERELVQLEMESGLNLKSVQ